MNCFVHNDELEALNRKLYSVKAEFRHEQCSAEKELRAVSDTVRDAIITVDSKARILHFNPAAERIFQCAAADTIGRDILRLFGTASQRLLKRYLLPDQCAEAQDTQQICECESRQMDGLRGDLEVFPAEVSVRQMEGCDSFVILVRDLSEQHRMVRGAIEMISHLQHEIGCDIHDGLGQEFTALMMLVSHMRRRAEGDTLTCGKACAEDFDKLTQFLTRAAENARKLAHGLTTVDIDQQGLSAALQRLVERMESVSGIPCSFSSMGNIDIDDQERIANLYRIAQEALSNAARHAEASSIEIRLEGTPEGLLLSVHDNGKGIGHRRSKQGDGIGLCLMRYRASVLGGACDFVSEPGGGTLIRCVVPLQSGDLKC